MNTEDKKTVLIAEDDKEFRTLLKRFLQHDFEVVLMENGQDAVDYLSEHTADIILTDVIMPKMDGIQFLQRLRTDENTKHIPAVVLLATASPEDVEKAKTLHNVVILPKEQITREYITEFITKHVL